MCNTASCGSPTSGTVREIWQYLETNKLSQDQGARSPTGGRRHWCRHSLKELLKKGRGKCYWYKSVLHCFALFFINTHRSWPPLSTTYSAWLLVLAKVCCPPGDTYKSPCSEKSTISTASTFLKWTIKVPRFQINRYVNGIFHSPPTTFLRTSSSWISEEPDLCLSPISFPLTVIIQVIEFL